MIETNSQQHEKVVYMLVPHRQLSSSVIRAIVEEFVTRDGTDHSLVERRVTDVLQQLDSGVVEIDFDRASGTCNILPVSTKR